MKVQISIDDELLKRADSYAEKNYMSRSGLLSLALTQYLNQFQALNALMDLSNSMKKIADTGVIDDDTRMELEDIVRLCATISGK